VALARATVAVDRRLALALAATLPFQALASAGFVVATGVLLGATPAVVADGFDSHAGHRLIGGIVAVAVLVVLQEALLPVQTALAETLGRRLDARVRSRAMRAASRPPGIAHLEDPAVLAGIRDVQAIGVAHYSPGDAVVGLVGTARARLAVLAAAVLVVRFHWWIAVVLVLFGLAVRARLVRDMLRAAESAADESAALRRSDYLRDLALRPEAAKEIRVFGLARWLLRRFADERLTTMRTLWRDRKQGAATAWTWAVPWAALTGGALYLLGRAAAEGRVSLETFAIAAQATLGAAAIWTSADDLRVAYGSASLATVERLEQATRPPATPPARRLPARIPERAIELRGLSFRYPGRAREVLGGFDLVLPAGGSVAIVGRNGAGKTTLLKLLLRLYEPTSGAVLVDGRDARGFDAAAWRRRFAVVFQDFVHYELSVTRNVAPAGGADLARVR
jgi:ATP-binding cassette subfamily B protein